MAAKLPIKYTGAVVLGSNISGVFVAIMSLISNQFSESVRTAAIYYFITAMFVLLICFDTYFALPLNVSPIYFFSPIQGVLQPLLISNRNITSITRCWRKRKRNVLSVQDSIQIVPHTGRSSKKPFLSCSMSFCYFSLR